MYKDFCLSQSALGTFRTHLQLINDSNKPHTNRGLLLAAARVSELLAPPGVVYRESSDECLGAVAYRDPLGDRSVVVRLRGLRPSVND